MGSMTPSPAPRAHKTSAAAGSSRRANRRSRRRLTGLLETTLAALLIGMVLVSCESSPCPPGVLECRAANPQDDTAPGETDPGDNPSAPERPPDEVPDDECTDSCDPEIPGEPEVPAGLVSVYVSPTGSGARDGSLDEPMSLRQGLLQSVVNRSEGRGTHVLLLPGVYRSALVPEWTHTGPAPIVIEALEPGSAVVSGSDAWTGWDCVASRCTHPWHADWGVAENPWPGDVEIGPLARRRELVLVNGGNLDQVERIEDLTPGSFHVDESADVVTVELPAGVTAGGAKFEVGIRERLFDSLHWPGVMVKGIVFEHSVPRFVSAGVLIGTATTFVDVTVRLSGQIGAYLEGSDISIWRSRFSDNGGDGFLIVRVDALEVVSSETSRNNWRGARGGFDEWGVGQKIARVHDARFVNHTSIGNWSRGLWFDWDNMNIEVTGLTSCDNHSDGLRVEGNQGPIVIEGSTICSNRGFGISANGSSDVAMTDNQIIENQRGGVHFEGEQRRVTSKNGETYVVDLERWDVVGNVVTASGSASLWSVSFWDLEARSNFFSSSLIDNNLYKQSDNSRPFWLQASGSGTLTFSQWQDLTGQEANSALE